MWTSQVYGHHDKMARAKAHRTSQNTEYTKTQQTLTNNYVLCFGTVNEKHWGFKPVFRCSKPHTFSIFPGEEKEKNVHSLFLTRPLRN